MKKIISMVAIAMALVFGVALAAEAAQVDQVQMMRLRKEALEGKAEALVKPVQEQPLRIRDVPEIFVPSEAEQHFQTWAQGAGDADGDGIQDTIDLTCPDTSHIAIKMRVPDPCGHTNQPAEVDGVSSDYVLPGGTLMRLTRYRDEQDGADFLFPDGINGMNKNGSPCIYDHPVAILSPRNRHYKVPCRDLMVHVFEAEKSPGAQCIDYIYVGIHKMVNIPEGWLYDNDPAHQLYQSWGHIYSYPLPSQTFLGARQAGIPTGCRIDFPITQWTGPDEVQGGVDADNRNEGGRDTKFAYPPFLDPLTIVSKGPFFLTPSKYQL
jgi:hypothetical protein